jgi:hypothetical protein
VTPADRARLSALLGPDLLAALEAEGFAVVIDRAVTVSRPVECGPACAAEKRDRQLCRCGHTHEMHDGGMRGSWCDGAGTWQSFATPAQKATFCKCRSFIPAEASRG